MDRGRVNDVQHWRQLVSKDNPDLHFWDVMGKTPIAVTISKWTYKKAVDGKELLFIGFEKGGKQLGKMLGLNVTNAYIIGKMHGNSPDGWIGKEITLRVANCKGEECLRVQYPKGLTFPRNIPKFNFTDTPTTNTAATGTDDGPRPK